MTNNFPYTGCLRKKYDVADYQYFKNGKTQQCNIFRYNKYNFRLVVCENSTHYVKRNESYAVEKSDVSVRNKSVNEINKILNDELVKVSTRSTKVS